MPFYQKKGYISIIKSHHFIHETHYDHHMIVYTKP